MPRNTTKALVGGEVRLLSPTDIKNCIAYRFYQNMLRGLATIRIEYQNLPDNIDPLFVGEKLLSTDMCYFRDEVLEKEYILPVVENGKYDVQGIPESWRVEGLNGYTRECNPEDSVIIRCTPCVVEGELMTPWAVIDYYAEKLAEVDLAISVNLKRIKTPWVFMADKKLKKTIEDFFTKLDNNEPYILVDKDFDELIKVLNTASQLFVPQLYDYKKSLWQEALTHLGITNTSIEKRERVTTSEVETNNAGTVMMRYLVLVPLQKAFDKINKMFNRDIKPVFRDNVGASLDGTSEIEDEQKEVENDNS